MSFNSLTPEERSQWNGLVDHADNLGTEVSPTILNHYKALNPSVTITPDHIPIAKGEVDSLKAGKPIGDMTPSDAAYVRSGMSDAYVFNPNNIRFPISPNHGTNLETHVNNSDIAGDPNQIKLDDLRTISGATGAKIQPGQTSGNYNVDTIRNIVKAAKHEGVDPNTALAVALQETHLGNKNPENIGNVYATYGKAPEGLNQQAYELAAFLKAKMDEGRKLGFKDEEHLIQMFNGMGKLKSTLTVNGKVQPTKFYGLTINPGESIDMRKNPLYGKTIKDLRENVVKKNGRIQKLIAES